ncbi:citrulline utilization hydrolase CtlX [Ekhidna sp.]
MSAPRLIMVRPTCFGSNPETLNDNVFQKGTISDSNTSKEAQKEFDAMVSLLRSNEIEVLVFDDPVTPKTPDSVFPNNWFSTHQNGKVFLYPMMSRIRREERRSEFIEYLKNEFEISGVIDLSQYEQDRYFLEGTGSMVLDHQSKIAYMCKSERSSKKVLSRFCKQSGYRSFVFHSIIDGKPVYHTNVIMGIGSEFVIACVESMREKELFRNLVNDSNKELIEITISQVRSFLGNCLEVLSRNGKKYLIVSHQAFLSLTEKQKNRLINFAKLLPVSIPTIEKYGGGSVRCMLAENYLSKKDQQIHA